MVHISLFVYIKILIFYLMKKILNENLIIVILMVNKIKLKDLEIGYVMNMKHLRNTLNDIQNNKINNNENNIKFNRYTI